MLDQTTTHLAVGRTSPAVQAPVSILSRKIWLPRLVYACLPWFYVGSGVAAFLGTLYINEWFWVLPHYLLFSAACIHFGIFVAAKRRSAARQNRQPSTQDP
ncbi:MAG: hypothetical protein R3315_01000 [Woeseiaceae bacterium]|nr:hypothetical protein [Woeseiaceae bacterium]